VTAKQAFWLVAPVALVLGACGPSPQERAAEQRATLARYCFDCHDDAERTAGLSLQSLDVDDIGADGAIWEHVARKLEAWTLPQGTLSQLMRDMAAGRPGLITATGLHTFVDPRHGGGRQSASAAEDLVELTTVGGREYLLYKSFSVDVAVIRATTADERGNLTMEREAFFGESFSIAAAAHRQGGIVIAQVERLAAAGTLHGKLVKVPGIVVDYVVLAPAQPQTYQTPYSPAYAGELREPDTAIRQIPFDIRKVIARRGAMELFPGAVVNLGFGVSNGISSVAAEESLAHELTLTVEQGIIGGVPAGGKDAGASVNYDMMADQPYQFDFYDGGGLDLACLGMAQADGHGNVNVSRFGGRFAGAGGFINITQNARALVFVGTFTAGGLRVEAGAGVLRIAQEGRSQKFVATVEQVTFNGKLAASSGQRVLYVTERCVFRLTSSGLELVEVAPGIDLERDILDLMDFRPLVADPKPMDERLFRGASMGLEAMLLDRPLADRFALDPARAILFIDYAGYRVQHLAQVEAVREQVRSLVEPLGRKVAAVIDYDSCTIDPTIAEAWFDMARDVQSRFYDKASRYSTSAFMRLKLGDALRRREMAPHVFETAAEDAARFPPAGE
jgi:propionate CoA-transferase